MVPNNSFKPTAGVGPVIEQPSRAGGGLIQVLGTMDEFSLAQYAPDGEILATGNLSVSQLSPRWLDLCSDLLNTYGPVFSRSMRSTLERFSIECAAPICHFKVDGSILYPTVLLVSSAEANHRQAVAHFVAQLSSDTPFTAPDRFPAFLVLNTFAPGIDENEGAALFQQAYHFAGAYFIWAGA